ncbi:MAG: HEAT repeat domain-containing protein [Solibacillus sp.]
MITNAILFGAVVIIAFLLLVIGLIFSYLVFKRNKEMHFQRKVNAYIETYEQEWYRYLLHGESIEEALKHTSFDYDVREAIDKIFITYVTTINNAEVRKNISRFATLNMQKHYGKLLESPEWADRLNVLRRTMLFDLQFLVPIIEGKLKQNEIEQMEEYLVVLQVISTYNPNLFLAHLYAPRMKMSEYDYKVILAHIDESYIKRFIRHFDELPIRLQLSLLDYLSLHTTMDSEYLYFYEKLLDSIHVEIRIRVLKAISTFGMVADLAAYEQFLTSSEWQERLMFAKVLRLVEGKQAVNMLQVLLCDMNWRVRKQAALTLKTKKNGLRLLQEMAHQTEDAFAADMAKEVLGIR